MELSLSNNLPKGLKTIKCNQLFKTQICNLLKENVYYSVNEINLDDV